jgi:hypothetical protein
VTEPKRERHRWPKLGNRMVEKTERECLRGCGIVRVTLHPHGRDGHEHRVEFYRNGELIPGTATPACEPVEVDA